MLANPGRERKSIHRSWHFDIGQYDVDARPAVLEHRKGLIRIGCFDDPIAAFTQLLCNGHSNQNLVLDNENGLGHRRGTARF